MRLAEIPFDRTSISQECLNIESKQRSNLLPWNGQFSPQLVHILLETYASNYDVVVDPFLGSGTVLVESARLGKAAFGTEINPAAFALAQTYRLINLDTDKRRKVLDLTEEI